MLGRTHEIVAVGAVTSAAILFPVENLNIETATLSFLVTLVGGITPDIDKPGSKIWDRIPAGGCLSRIINPVFAGGHRHITHSMLGIAIFGVLGKVLLGALPLGESINADIILVSFLIALASHVVADMLTKDGVPILFPLPFHFGFPPVKALRLETNGLVEKLLIVPGIIILIGVLAYLYPDNAKELFNLLD